MDPQSWLYVCKIKKSDEPVADTGQTRPLWLETCSTIPNWQATMAGSFINSLQHWYNRWPLLGACWTQCKHPLKAEGHQKDQGAETCPLFCRIPDGGDAMWTDNTQVVDLRYIWAGIKPVNREANKDTGKGWRNKQTKGKQEQTQKS